MRSGGGGGFGSALEREPEQVAFDVAEFYVSRQTARDIYGVVLGPDGSVDEKATEKLRQRMRG